MSTPVDTPLAEWALQSMAPIATLVWFGSRESVFQRGTSGKPRIVPRATEPKSTIAPKMLDRASVEDRALSYLNRFDASAARLTRVLEQFVRQRAKELAIDAIPFLEIVRETVERYQRSGLLDDRRFSEVLARSLAQRGTSRQVIKAKLASRGIVSSVIDEVVGGLAGEVGTELDAAKNLVRRRKLGRMRPAGERREQYRRDLGILARAGFDIDTAKAALNVEASDEDDEF